MRKIIPFLFIFILLAGNFSTASASTDTHPIISVYYAGNPGFVKTAINLYGGFKLVDDPQQAEVIVLNGTIPKAQTLAKQISAGTGLFLILGPDISSSDLDTLFSSPVKLVPREDPLSLIDAETAKDSILQDVIWNSAPQVRERLDLRFSSHIITPLVEGYEDRSLILGKANIGRGNAYIFTPSLNGANSQFQDWAYFNYFIYHLVVQAAGGKGGIPMSFADYPASPVPHASERMVLILMLAGILILAVLTFWTVRRYSLAHPELLDSLVVSRVEFETRQASTDWDEIGFHRPLGGFMLAFMLGLVLFIPLIIYQNLILPVYILPSAQALGIWGRVTQFFNFLWLFLDMGTSAAFIKFFAQYRVHDPHKAIQYGQVFVWWQALSGAVQVAVVTMLAGTLLPRTIYALYTWSIIVHTLIQIPGFYQVMRHALMGWQRFDYAQILDLGLYLIFPIIAQPLVVSIMVAWGKTHPVFGQAMGGLIGLGLAAYAIEALTFLLGLWLYRRLGYNLRLIFLAHFDWEIVKSAFRFGVYEMLGSVAWAVGQAMEILITQNRLVNYTEVWGNWGLAQNFVFAFNALQTLYNNMMPSISESISHARQALSQYYAAVSYKWGGIISAFIGSVLLAVADRFILGASGPEFVRAATYAVPLIIWGAIQYPSWVGDGVQLGSNRPYIKAGMVAGEQIVRIALAFVLLERFQINALIIAYFVGLLAKDISSYFINHKICFPQRFFFWQSLGAPLLAGIAHYAVLRWATGLIWNGNQITSILIFLIGILLSYPLFAFFYGLFGGWDDATLAELRHSVDLSNFMRPLAMIFWESTRLGANISPLHGKFPITIREAAIAEANSLTNERVDIV
jgi:O-antigen/teichoic acid export membrane protein